MNMNFVKNKPMNYSERLTHPYWQRKRLEIFNRDNWTCLICKDSTTQLEIHHTEYFEGKKPWEYPDNMLMTLCHKCHQEEQKRYMHEIYLLQAFRTSGYTAMELLAIAQMLYAIKPFNDLIKKHVATFIKGKL